MYGNTGKNGEILAWRELAAIDEGLKFFENPVEIHNPTTGHTGVRVGRFETDSTCNPFPGGEVPLGTAGSEQAGNKIGIASDEFINAVICS